MDTSKMQDVYVVIFAHLKWGRQSLENVAKQASFFSHFARCCVPWRLSSTAVTTEILPYITRVGAGEPAECINNEEPGARV